MPAVFVGHGSPMNAIEDNEFSRTWGELGKKLPRPKAILCISAHWESRGVALTSAEKPETIHDFYGFPQSLFAVEYPAPGDLALARKTAALLKGSRAVLDGDRGLDHGAWSVLKLMYPKADIPVVQLSMDTSEPAAAHLALAKKLAPLREEGVLILGSGNIVHNLRLMEYRSDKGYDWAERINSGLKSLIGSENIAALTDYPTLDPDIRKAIPTPEHYLPLLYILAVKKPEDSITFFNDKTVMGSISMTSVILG